MNSVCVCGAPLFSSKQQGDCVPVALYVKGEHINRNIRNRWVHCITTNGVLTRGLCGQRFKKPKSMSKKPKLKKRDSFGDHGGHINIRFYFFIQILSEAKN